MSKNAAFLRGQGVRAKQKAKALPRGKGIPTMIYPRPMTRALIVKAANASNVRMSNWIICACLEKIATDKVVPVRKLIPATEFQELQRTRGKG